MTVNISCAECRGGEETSNGYKESTRLFDAVEWEKQCWTRRWKRKEKKKGKVCRDTELSAVRTLHGVSQRMWNCVDVKARQGRWLFSSLLTPEYIYSRLWDMWLISQVDLQYCATFDALTSFTATVKITRVHMYICILYKQLSRIRLSNFSIC